MTKRNKAPNFEQSLNELEKIVAAMENDELPLEEALKQFERGVGLTRECQVALTTAEQRVKILLANNELAEFTKDDDE